MANSDRGSARPILRPVANLVPAIGLVLPIPSRWFE